ncbi:hypothetical protein K450DRAFT_228597 [Umbelopsis ramanniana AG]|uniref:Uncharacterized protein n=1 Tax=Umbelopsis ramanniana AG TaxID=1314678 RepID=A0AAD5HH77_UMBRA|nr:uncharacterized protein K450DRAFT_228597 [Umbelopsis ramanniana AG]KAI8582361.1 hypothetical protein K450DRAFT_228597 [Umbelopsis ramanniana AG]
MHHGEPVIVQLQHVSRFVGFWPCVKCRLNDAHTVRLLSQSRLQYPVEKFTLPVHLSVGCRGLLMMHFLCLNIMLHSLTIEVSTYCLLTIYFAPIQK